MIDLSDQGLHRVVTRRLRSLGEVTIIKTPRTSVVRAADGRTYSFPEVVRLERAAQRERGAHSEVLREHLLAAAPSDLVEIILQYRAPAISPPLSAELRAEDHDRRTAALDRRARQLRSARQALVTLIDREGRMISEARFGPFLSAELPARVVQDLGYDDSVVYLSTASPATALPTADTDPVSSAWIDLVYNANGVYGNVPPPVDERERVGILESSQSESFPCGFYTGHEAFEHASYVYFPGAEPTECSSDVECTGGFGGDCGYCRGGVCVAEHGTRVASVVSASDDGVSRGASEVEFYYPSGRGACDSGLYETLDWFVENDVRVVNGSHGCFGFGAELYMGQIPDFYAREHGITFTFASGPNTVEPTEACPYSLNAICVGGSTSVGGMYCKSPYVNPPMYNGDREEPDLVALAGQDLDCSEFEEAVRLADMDESGTAWVGNDGVSYAAPAIAAIVVLQRDLCRRNGRAVPTSARIRAELRTDAFRGNPDGLQRYSTPSLGTDFRDGAGLVHTQALYDRCASSPPPAGDLGNPSGDEVEIDLGGGDPMPSGEVAYEPGVPRDEGYEPLNYSEPTESTRRGRQLANFEGLQPGSHLRFTYSWYSCVEDEFSFSYESIAKVDFDVFLYNRTEGRYIYGSQSIDDVNEGFDVAIEEADGEGDYEVWLSWPEGAEGCHGGSSEFGAWAARVWM